MDFLRCAWCDIDEHRPSDPLFPHQHHYGEIPVTPCRACSVRACDYCDPLTYWCACKCGLKEATNDGDPAST